MTADELRKPLPRPRRCACGEELVFDAHPKEHFAFLATAVITEE